MINKMKLALAGAIVATGMVSNAAYAATEQADATVQVLAAVQLSAVTDLDFSLGAASGATPSASGVIAISGGAPASFQVTQATDGEVIDLTVGNPAPLTGPGADIALSGLTLSTGSITFDSGALETVYVGGTISLNPNQVAGTYTGTFDVTAEYQ